VPTPARDYQNRTADVDGILRTLGVGSIAFNVPPKMRLEDTTTIQLLLSPQKTIAELRQKLRGVGETEGARIEVADVMEASLYGHAFETRKLTPERQAVSNSAETEWGWDITAKQPGSQELQLVISVVLNVKGHEAPRVLDVYRRTIDVQVTMGSRISAFVANNWQWLLGLCGGLPLTAVGWAIARRRRHRHRKIWDALSAAGKLPEQK
jgi:hypothetical protein